MFLSVICAEDAPFIAAEEIERLAQGSFLGAHQAREFVEACKVWPRGEVPPGYREAVRSDAPALLLSGELDPVTPPSWAEEALKTLPNGRHVIAAGVGHGVTSIGCFPDVVQAFIEAGSAAKLDVSCAKALKRPPFFLSFAGPRP
jgi:pimeloyl-ACP methyl ester carboxylesterase